MKNIIYSLVIIFLIGCEEKITHQEQMNANTSTSIYNVNGVYPSDGLYFPPFKINKDELQKMAVKAERGDIRVIEIFIKHYSMGDINHTMANYWSDKFMNIGNLELRTNYIYGLELDKDFEKAQNFRKKWHLEKYRPLKKLLLSDIGELEKNANNGDYIAMYILADYYFKTHPAKSNFYYEKLAFSDNPSKVEAQRFILTSSIMSDANRSMLRKKWHLEYLVPPSDIQLKAEINGRIIEYRDNDPKGVFFDENGSVIKYE